MVGALLLRGMLVGLVAGLLAFGFARVFGEPQVDRAIAFEEQSASGGYQHADEPVGGGQAVAAHDHDGEVAASGHQHGGEEELVSRGTQAGLGLLTGVVVYGAALGGLFSLVFSYANGRLGTLGPRGAAGLIALAGFIAVVVVPDIKYPANPPAVGSGDTIGFRTGLFFIFLLISVVAMVLSVRLAKRLWAQHGAWNASIAAALAFVAVMAIAGAVLPVVNEVPAAFSANVLWSFRVASLGIHAILWTVIGLGFGAVAEHYLAGNSSYPATRRPAFN